MKDKDVKRRGIMHKVAKFVKTSGVLSKIQVKLMERIDENQYTINNAKTDNEIAKLKLKMIETIMSERRKAEKKALSIASKMESKLGVKVNIKENFRNDKSAMVDVDPVCTFVIKNEKETPLFEKKVKDLFPELVLSMHDRSKDVYGFKLEKSDSWFDAIRAYEASSFAKNNF